MIIDEEFLEHYGVPGMKWGVRKSPGERAAATRSKNQKTAKRKELKAASKLTLGEVAVTSLFAGPVGILGYKALKVNTARQKQAARDKGGGRKEQDEAARVSVGTAVALSLVATPLTAVAYAGAKAGSNANVKTFQPKQTKKTS